MNENKEMLVNHSFDYSNIVAEIENISNLVKYCDQLYNHLLKLCNEDEQKNMKFKEEYKNFEYKKSYQSKFEISIREGTDFFSNQNCKSYNSFQELIKNGQLNNIKSLNICLDLSYKSGNARELIEYQNTFTITFKPYDIIFVRKSNHEQTNMNGIEKNINDILKQFKVQNTIFKSM